MKSLESIYKKVKQVTEVDVRTKSRLRNNIYAKKIYCTIARQKGHTFKTIGDFIGIDHATVLWHCNDTKYLLKQDESFMNNYLRVQGKPVEGKICRDFFDMSVALHTK
jgi:chromosomal replication initiation ATPase DnaA